VDKEVLVLRKAGVGYKKIAKQLGLTNIQVSDILFDNGIMDHMILPDTDIQDVIVKQYLNGSRIKDIAEVLHCSSTTVRNVLKVKNCLVQYKRNGLNHEYFDNIDSEHKAYWFGFILADGCNLGHHIEISLQYSDKDHLEILKADTGCLSKVAYKACKYQSGVNEAARLCLYSTHMCEQLSEKGCVPRKSLVVNFPSIIPEKLISHFMRGYFDGNGCIYFHEESRSCKFTIDSTEQFCAKFFQVILNNTTDITSTPKYYYRSTIGSMQMSGRINTLKALDFLYNNATVKLQRKYDKFLELLMKPFHDVKTSGKKSCELLENLRRKYLSI